MKLKYLFRFISFFMLFTTRGLRAQDAAVPDETNSSKNWKR